MATKKTTRKPAAKKTAEVKAPEPMDPGAREAETAEPIAYASRPCYAALVLANEVTALFDAEVEYASPNGRNVNRDVYFTSSDADLRSLLALVGSDARVELVDFDTHENMLIVAFHNNPATYDNRDPFGLAQAHVILTEGRGDISLDDNDDFALTENPDGTEADAP